MSNWVIMAGSSIGSAHLNQQAGCEDAFVVRDYDGVLVAAIGDGCSSERFSAVGATIAVSLAVEVARMILASLDSSSGRNKEYWQQFLVELEREFMARFSEAGWSVIKMLGAERLDALATTLSVTVVDRPWIAVLSFGDGFIVTQDTDNHLDLLVQPEYLDNTDSVTFITTSGATVRVQREIAYLPDLAAIAMCTDGLMGSALEFDGSNPVRPFAKFFLPLFRWVAKRSSNQSDAKLLGFLASSEIRKKTDDDMTLILAVHQP